jgi:hypothetical protein
MSEFSFDPNKPFEVNLQAFLAELDSYDKEMTDILRRNIDKLIDVVRQGNRSGPARSEFNAEIVKALDAMISTDTGKA